MNAEKLLLLAREALRQDAAVTPGPWVETRDKTSAGDRAPIGRPLIVAGPIGDSTTIARLHDRATGKPNGRWIAAARTREPVLARAVLALLARARHSQECDSHYPVNMNEDPPRYLPCSCGLDAAIEGIEDDR